MRETMDWLLGQFPDLRMTIEAAVADRDTVAIRVYTEGTNLGRLNGMLPASGRPFAAPQGHWFRLRDEHWAVRDDLLMLRRGVETPRLAALLRQLGYAARHHIRRRPRS